MSGILKLQVISFISRIMAMLLGIFQSLIIVNLLTKDQYGLIGLATSIAGIAGITQHLGLASSSTKEISQAKNSQEIFNIVFSSLSIRMLVSLPISLILLIFASPIANYYGNLDLVFPLQIFGLITLVQAFQSIFNSVISGTQKFKLLFTYQVVIAMLSIFIFLPLVFTKGLIGYFYALLAFNIIQTLILAFYSFKDLNFKFVLPNKDDFFNLCGKLLKVSLAIYLVKILFTAWQEVPVAYLGKVVSLESLALFTFAFNLSGKLMAISDSVTDVNLPVFSKKSVESLKDYLQVFLKNYNLLFYFILVCGISVSFWSKEILIASDIFVSLVGKLIGMNFEKNIFERYSSSIVLFLPLILSYVFYSYLNIFKSSFFVPLEKLKQMIICYAVLIIGSAVSFFSLNKYFYDVLAMSYAVFLGSLLAFILSIYFINQDLAENFLDLKKILFSLFSITIALGSSYIELDFYSKAVIFISYLFLIFYIFKINLFVLFKKQK